MQFQVARGKDQLPAVNAYVGKDAFLEEDWLRIKNLAALNPQFLVDELAIPDESYVGESNDGSRHFGCHAAFLVFTTAKRCSSKSL